MADPVQALPPRYDPADPVTLADPYPVYRELRARAAFCRAGPGTWAVTRHREVSALLRDPRLANEFPIEYHRLSAGDGPAAAFFHRIVLYRDAPVHTRLRRLLATAFTGPRVRTMRAEIGAMVDGLLARARDTGSFDAVDTLAFPLPVAVVCQLMGIPEADHDEVRPRAVDLGRAFTAVVAGQDRGRADDAVMWLRSYVGELLEHRRRRPADDLLSRLLHTVDDGERLTYDEIVDNTVFSFFAGFETTVNLISTGCAALTGHPDQLARLRADRSLVGSAVEEFLRWDAPIQGTARMVREPIEAEGRTLRAGRVLILLLGSANHDDTVFADPERLDVGRTPNPHVAFGGGPHHCLGAMLARLEAAVVFERLLDTFATIEPAGVPEREHDSPFRTYSSIPLAVSA